MEDGKMVAAERLNVLAAEINVIKDHVQQTALAAACEIGRRLIEIKGYLAHGQFGGWLRENVDYSERDAQRLMQMFEKYGKNPIAGAEKLSISQAVALISAPEDVRREMIESGAAQDMSVRQLKEELDKLKAEADSRQLTIDSLTADLTAERSEREKLAKVAEDAMARAKQKIEEKAKLREEKNELEDDLSTLEDEKEKLEKKVAEAERRAKEAEAAQRVEVVEVLPPEAAAEMERLKEIAAKAPDRATILAREHFNRGVESFEAALAMLGEMEAESRAKYAAAFATGLRRMAERMEAANG